MTIPFAALLILGLYTFVIGAITKGWWTLNKFKPDISQDSVNVSVIVAVRNEEKHIEALLRGLLQQDYPAQMYEVVIINDHSDDATAEQIEKALAKWNADQSVKVIVLNLEEGKGKKAAVAKGIEVSTGELILLTDADCQFSKFWVKTMADFYDIKMPQLILGPVRMSNDESFSGRMQSLEFISLIASGAGACSKDFPIMSNGANMGVSRSAFFACGGFEGNMQYPSGDDMFLMMKIKKEFGVGSVKFIRAREAIVDTPAVDSFGEFIQQRLRWVSKSRGYTDPLLIAISILVFLTNALLVSGLVLSLFFGEYANLTAWLFVIKMLVDMPLLYSFCKFVEQKKLIWLVPIMEPLVAIYTLVIGIAGNLGVYQWKGRKIGRR